MSCRYSLATARLESSRCFIMSVMANLKSRTNVFLWICWLAHAINGGPWNRDGSLTFQLDPKAANEPNEGLWNVEQWLVVFTMNWSFKKRWRSTLHIVTFDRIPQFYYNKMSVTLFRKAATKCFNHNNSWLTKQELMSLQHFSSWLIKSSDADKTPHSWKSFPVFFSLFLSHMGWNWISFFSNLHLSAK